MEPCACPPDDFNPVCDLSNRVEYLTPCHAGCTTRVVPEALNKSQVGQASGCSLYFSWALCPSLSLCGCHTPQLGMFSLSGASVCPSVSCWQS